MALPLKGRTGTTCRGWMAGWLFFAIVGSGSDCWVLMFLVGCWLVLAAVLICCAGVVVDSVVEKTPPQVQKHEEIRYWLIGGLAVYPMTCLPWLRAPGL